jgi:hypothetical protein
MNQRGVVHEAAAVFDGVQRCRLCGIELPLPVETQAGWQVGALIVQRLSDKGETMTCSRSLTAVEFPYCDSN